MEVYPAYAHRASNPLPMRCARRALHPRALDAPRRLARARSARRSRIFRANIYGDYSLRYPLSGKKSAWNDAMCKKWARILKPIFSNEERKSGNAHDPRNFHLPRFLSLVSMSDDLYLVLHSLQKE
jgi:hypothetical protein